MNWSILGYISRGEIVPDVMTTLLKRSNTGFIAIDGSRHLSHTISKVNARASEKTNVKWSTGFGTVALSVSKGSRISKKPIDVMNINERRAGLSAYLYHKLLRV